MDIRRDLVGILFRKEVTRGDTKNVGWEKGKEEEEEERERSWLRFEGQV